MKPKTLIYSALLVVGVMACDSDTKERPIVENSAIAYVDGQIITCSDQMPTANLMVVADGIITFVGNKESEAGKEALNSASKRLSLQGLNIVPGFIDAHTHPVLAVALNDAADLKLNSDWDEETIRIKSSNYLYTANNDTLLFAYGYSRDKLGVAPTAALLDQISSSIPIFFLGDKLQTAWVNTKALEKAGITAETADIVPGLYYYERGEDNLPNGYLVGVETWIEVARKLGIFCFEQLDNQLTAYLKHCSALGYTTLFDASSYGFNHESLSLLNRLNTASQLPLRYCSSYYYERNRSVNENISTLTQLSDSYSNSNLQLNTLKLQLDGTVETRTAALIEHYSDIYGNGGLAFDTQVLNDVTRVANDKSLDIHFDVVGDRAIAQALKNLSTISQGKSRYILAHNEVTTLPVMKLYEQYAHRIGCNFTPTRATVSVALCVALGMDIYEFDLFRVRSIYDEGISVSFGTDYPSTPASELSPLVQIAASQKRSIEGWLPPIDEKLTFEQALKAHTIHAARQLGIDSLTGSLQEGKIADFVILNGDRSRIIQTYFKGNIVYK